MPLAEQKIEISGREWMKAVRETAAPFVFFGVDAKVADPSEKLQGMAGFIDWSLHGQVSSLVLKNPELNSFSLIPHPAGKTSFILFYYSEKPSSSLAMARIKKLPISDLALAETTFPEDFLRDLKHALKKEGIRCTKLEPEIT